MDREELNTALKVLIKSRDTIKKVQDHLNDLNDSIMSQLETVDKYRQFFLEEDLDLKQFENNSLQMIFSKFLGKGQEMLEIKRQERLTAFVKLEEARALLEVMNYEKEVLIKKLLSIDFDEVQLKDLLAKKEILLRRDITSNIELKNIDIKVDKIEAETIEIDQALAESHQAIDFYNQLKKELSLIRNWNQFEYHGAGKQSSYKKKKYIEKNLELVANITLHNDLLLKELEDLKTKYHLDLTQDLIILNNFFSIFLDNMLTDWIVQKGLKTATQTIEHCIAKLTRIEKMLVNEKKMINNALGLLQKEREQLIIRLNPEK